MIYFYWQLKKGQTPTYALSISSKWLRKLTYARLERLYNVVFTSLPESERPLRPFLRRKLDQLRKMSEAEKKEKCFDHPYYYSAFVITGK
jgi:CHAT domain-containing protein